MRLASRGIAVALLLGAVACSAEDSAPAPETTSPDGTVVLDSIQRSNAGLRVVDARRSEVHPTVVVPATLAPPDTAVAEVGSLVEGRVERVLVVEGARVRAGEELARIHSHELTSALRDLASAEARADYAAQSLERALRLLEADAIARSEVERRRAEAAAAEAERESAREIVHHLHPSEDGSVTVVAPVAGVVLEASVRSAQAVTPGSRLFTVGPDRVLWATAYVPESVAVGLEPGATATVRFRALPDTAVPGRLVSVGRGIDPDTRTVSVRVELERVPAGVRSGMFTTVQLSESAAVVGVEVPTDAVQQVDGEDAVFVEVSEGRYRPVSVRSSLSGPERLVVQGVEEGARIVVQGAYVLKAMLQQAGAAGGEE